MNCLAKDAKRKKEGEMSQESQKHLLNILCHRKADRYPVWFMRQAGRYLPEYRAVREKLSFMDLCRSPDDACEVTVQPLRRYDLDASIIFSDILIPCTILGQTLSFDKRHGPRLDPPIRSQSQVEALETEEIDAVEQLSYVGKAIQLVKRELKPHQTMIGFAGAPFTVACYMVQGSGSKNFNEVKKLLFSDPSTFKRLLEKIATVTKDYLKMQVAAGADVLMLFDTWANQLTPMDFSAVVKPILYGLIADLKSTGVPLIYFPGQGGTQLGNMRGFEGQALAIDWRVPLDQAFDLTGSLGLDCALQGNLDPLLLVGPEAVVRSRTKLILEQASAYQDRGHIFNLGHGLVPETPPVALEWVIDEIRKWQ